MFGFGIGVFGTGYLSLSLLVHDAKDATAMDGFDGCGFAAQERLRSTGACQRAEGVKSPPTASNLFIL